MRLKSAVFVLAISAVSQGSAQTQSLGLFEPFEESAVAESQPATAVQPPQATEINRLSAPQFVLIGTSRFGDRHRARLKTASGETVVVDLSGDGNVPVPGFPGYQIEEAADRQLMIRHPDNTPCFAAPDQGVNCPSNNVAQLKLTTAQAIQAPAAERGSRAEPEATDTGNANTESAPDNPFAAALRAARERATTDPAVSRAEAERFRPRRIDPADVPPGARLVRTPFGDRIVRDQ